MSKTLRVVLITVLIAAAVGMFGYFITHADMALFNTKGTIGNQQRDLIVFTMLLGLVVIIPVFAMTFFFAWRYRESNHRAKYTPNVSTNKLAETIWWGIPCAIILVLAVITWNTSHSLDPYRPLNSTAKPLKVQVVALQWKWLFIYPEQNIASVNELHIPTHRPINFTITSDAPMNSFWIPSLGGQVYAMSGMSTQLHLDANTAGTYKGVSANISGEGFSDMKFSVRAQDQTDFDAWVTRTKSGGANLTAASYDELAKPSTVKQPIVYNGVTSNLYDAIIMKYMEPASTTNTQETH